MPLLEWLASILSELFPPWVQVGPDEEAVRIRNIPLPQGLKRRVEGRYVFRPPLCFLRVTPPNGQIIRLCGPGFVFSIPFLDEVRKVNVRYGKVDIVNEDSLEVETADGRVYSISIVLEYRVTDTMRALLEVENYHQSLVAAVQSIVVHWANEQVGRIRATALIEECGPRITAGLGPKWGCRVLGIEVNSIAPLWEVKELWHRLGPPISSS